MSRSVSLDGGREGRNGYRKQRNNIIRFTGKKTSADDRKETFILLHLLSETVTAGGGLLRLRRYKSDIPLLGKEYIALDLFKSWINLHSATMEWTATHQMVMVYYAGRWTEECGSEYSFFVVVRTE